MNGALVTPTSAGVYRPPPRKTPNRTRWTPARSPQVPRAGADALPSPDRCRSADSNHSGNPFPRTEPESGKALELDSPTEPRAFPFFGGRWPPCVAVRVAEPQRSPGLRDPRLADVRIRGIGTVLAKRHLRTCGGCQRCRLRAWAKRLERLRPLERISQKHLGSVMRVRKENTPAPPSSLDYRAAAPFLLVRTREWWAHGSCLGRRGVK